ncbi:MAG: ATP synthase F0 subunit B, partial [Patescibacteria group bacterium]
MEIIQQFGIQPIMLAAQAVNFLIILYVLKRFLYKPMLSVLKKRKDEIALGLRNAEEARILLEKTAEAEKNVLKLAQAQAKKMIDEAK